MTRYRSTQRRGKRPEYSPIRERVKELEAIAMERSNKIMSAMFPDGPEDAEPLDDKLMWTLLEGVAVRLSPMYWDEPDALSDLARLRSKFAPALPSDYLKPLAEAARKAKRQMPDLSVTQVSPEYEKEVARLTRAQGGRSGDS
jgi:hypothetical protein